MTSPFQPGPTRTIGGDEVLIYCTDAPGRGPIHGRFESGLYAGAVWRADELGELLNYPNMRLAPPGPKRLRVNVWVNEYEDAVEVFPDENAAKNYFSAKCLRIAVPCWLTEILPGDPEQ